VGCLATKKCIRKIHGRPTVDDRKAKSLKWRWATQAIKHAENTGSEADRAKGAYPGCSK
jgi:hypothetical protein